MRRAGFPRGTFQTLLIESRQVESVLSDERVAAVTVTGSEAAGRAVAAQAGWLIKRSVLELGGSDPFVVMPSADLDRAIETAVKSRCVNNGQSCIAAKRFIVHEAIYETFEQRFVAAMEALTVGDPTKDTTDIGPLATAQTLEDLEHQVQAATRAGARVLCGGERMIGAGNFFEPTVLAGVPRTASVYRDEMFGPVATLFSVASLSEAIEVANDTPFGLGASVWTTDADEQKRLVAEIEAGQVFVNTWWRATRACPSAASSARATARALSRRHARVPKRQTVVIAEPVQQTEIAFEPPAASEDTLRKLLCWGAIHTIPTSSSRPSRPR